MTILFIIFGTILVCCGIMALIPALIGAIAPIVVTGIIIWIVYRVIRKGLKVIKDKTE